ncbi:MAG: cyclic nucleotide-binding domain-containing protein [Deltaproteobacteria bacterium]|nr:cyclic nucleotide-binding domain-containing protein [Deltaproteobacteria bacterium]
MAVEVGGGVEERHAMLEDTHWAAEFTWEELKHFARYLHVFKVAKEMNVFTEGSVGSNMFILVAGRVDIVKEDLEGNRKVVTTIPPGKAFGEMALFDGEQRSATVMAAEHSTMLVLTKENLQRLLDDQPRLAGKLLLKLGKIISQRLRATTGQLVDLI